MEIIIFIGIQAVGKSEFYKQFFLNTHIRLNMDMLKTRHREDILLHACLDSKQPFVIDNTNPLKENRAKYIEKAKNASFKVTGYYFKSAIAEAINHNKERHIKERVPQVALLSTYSKLELPTIGEGFDQLYYVEMDGHGSFIVKEFTDEI